MSGGSKTGSPLPFIPMLVLKEAFDHKPTSRLRALRSYSGERARPRVLSLAPRQRLFSIEKEKNFSEAPKWAREARALLGKQMPRGSCQAEKVGTFVQVCRQ